MSELLAEHRHYLADAPRLVAYAQAISTLVRPGDVVIDLGAGSGVLGLLACRAGAARVYAVDDGPVIELARRLCEANGFADRVVFVRGHSLEVELPERADVVVADQIGFGGEFGILQFFRDACERLLKPGGTLIPTSVGLCLAPIEAAQAWEQIAFWDTTPAGFDLRPAREIAVNTRYRVSFTPSNLLGMPTTLATLDLAVADDAPLVLDTTLVAERPGILHGLGGWFDAQLAPGVGLTNLPTSPEAIAREALFFPVDRPIELAEGDELAVRLHIRWADDLYTWQIDAWPRDARTFGVPKASFKHSTWKSLLLTPQDLQRSRPDFTPALPARSAAHAFVLSLCDGRHTLAEIEQAVLQRYPQLFHTQSAAAAFVAGLVQRYAH